MQTAIARRVMINGREILMSGHVARPEDLKESAGIDPSRNLLRQTPDGNELLTEGQELRLADGDYFSDAPTFKYG